MVVTLVNYPAWGVRDKIKPTSNEKQTQMIKITNEQKKSIEDCVKAVYAKAEKLWQRGFPLPSVFMQNHGTTAGKAWYRENRITLNPGLFNENEKEFFERTIPHEAAHLIAWQIYGKDLESAHGWQWKEVMWRLGYKATRCHSYATESVRRKTISDLRKVEW